MYAEDRLIPISALQHWVFCPRQCGLIHLEGQWEENRLTAQGRLLHEKAHEGGSESRGQVRIERGLALRSLSLGLVGVADVVEFHRRERGRLPFPVEYKRGRPKEHDADRLQLTAQAICLEEMLGCSVPRGALFYGTIKRREEVEFTSDLRQQVARHAAQVHAMLEAGITPAPRAGPHCRNCSLAGRCLPEQSAVGGGASRFLRRQIQRALEEP
jgi:CRISPR-associated exonuclease Cas4